MKSLAILYKESILFRASVSVDMAETLFNIFGAHPQGPVQNKLLPTSQGENGKLINFLYLIFILHGFLMFLFQLLLLKNLVPFKKA